MVDPNGLKKAILDSAGITKTRIGPWGNSDEQLIRETEAIKCKDQHLKGCKSDLLKALVLEKSLMYRLGGLFEIKGLEGCGGEQGGSGFEKRTAMHGFPPVLWG